MAYRHGVYVSEVPTSVVPPVRVDAATPFFVGAAPVHLVAKTAAEAQALVNKPVLAYTYAEAVEALGMADSSDWGNYTLCECAYSQFVLFGVAPAIFVNVFDPTANPVPVARAEYAIANRQASLGKNVLRWTVGVYSGLDEEESAQYVEGTDYSLAYDDDGNLIVNALPGGALASATTLYAEFSRCDPSTVTAAQVIGGYNTTTGKYTGLELIEACYPKWKLIPGFIVCPSFSSNSGVAAVMAAKASSINGSFRCMALCDVPCGTGGVLTYSDVTEWKNTNNYTAAEQVVCWPMVALGGIKFHLSVQLAGLMGKIDAESEGVPYASPSNHNLQMDSAVLDDAAMTEVTMTKEQATFLNGNGIVTALNWSLGWVAWGNRTGCYPGITDTKDAFIPERRMFQYIGNTLILSYWQKVDQPITKRLIQTICDSVQMWLNGLAAREWLVGKPKIEFLESENPTTDLIDGIIRLHVYITPPVPAREIDFILEYDVNQMDTLFE